MFHTLRNKYTHTKPRPLISHAPVTSTHTVDLTQTAIYQCLTNNTSARKDMPNIVAVLSNYIKHDYDLNIPIMTTKLLKNIAEVPMCVYVYACL